MLHALASRDAPVQVLPPLLGEGFVQLRLRSFSPVPQLLLQEFHELHFDQPPSTTKKRETELTHERLNICVTASFLTKLTSASPYSILNDKQIMTSMRMPFACYNRCYNIDERTKGRTNDRTPSVCSLFRNELLSPA